MKAPQQIVVTDWFRLLWDMVQRDCKLLHIERRTGIKESTLREYLNGSQPPHWRGELLIGLWCDVCARARADAPTTEMILAPRVVHPPPQVQPTADALADLSSLTHTWRDQA